LERQVLINENRIFLIVRGDKGAVVLSKYLNEYNRKNDCDFWSLYYHTVKKQNNWEKPSEDICSFIGKPCFCDGRTLTKKIKEYGEFPFLEEEYKYLK